MYILLGITIFLTLLGFGIIIETLIEHKFTKTFAVNALICFIIGFLWTVFIYIFNN